jgi:hypothetical protein
MELTPYVDAVRNELAVAAEAGGPEARALAERLAAPLESAIRLTLLDALSAAASEITRDLAPGSVDLRLRGREPSFVVTPPPAERQFEEPTEPDKPSPSAAARPPVEAAREAMLSVNAWLVRAAAAALAADEGGNRPPNRAPRGTESYSGWVR